MPRPYHGSQVGQLDLQHAAVQEEQRGEGLILRGCAHLLPSRQVAQEGRDRLGPERRGVPLPVKDDEPIAPSDIRLLGRLTQVAQAGHSADLFK